MLFSNRYCEPEHDPKRGFIRCEICSSTRPMEEVLEYEYSDGEILKICSLCDPLEFINSYPISEPDETEWEELI